MPFCHPRWSRSLVVWALAPMLLATACGKKADPEPTGSAKIAVTGSALTQDVAKVVLTITKGDGPDIPAIVFPLTRNGNDWAGFVTGIPASSGRLFEVKAYDGSNAVVLSGSAKADILSGGVATVVIFLSKPGDGTQNKAPVLESLTASATLVKPKGTVSLAVRAKDPDAGDSVTLDWKATCGTFDAPAAANTVWTAPDGAGFCQLSITATDTHAASVTAYLVIEVNTVAGDAQVIVRFNSPPVIYGLSGDIHYRNGGFDGKLAVDATDPDGDTLGYAWSSSCADLTFDTAAPNSPTRPAIVRPVATGDCVVTVQVTDPPEKQGKTVGVLVIGPEPVENIAPVITNTVQPLVDLTDPRRPSLVNPGQAVLLGAYGRDPEGKAIVFSWTSTAGTFAGQMDQSDRSVVTFTTPTPLPADLRATVRVTDPEGAFTERVFYFKADASADPCVGRADGTVCDDGNLCTTGDVCTAGSCGGGTATVCAASGQCKVAGTCNPATGTCSNPNAVDGTSCNDGALCTTSDVCGAGTCVGTAVVCVASGACRVAGTCDPASGVCSNPAAPNGTSCSDGNLCTVGDACQTGTCTAGLPLTCTALDACHVAGTCNPSTGSCSNPNAPDGTACSDGSLCTQADACASGTCGGTPLACTPGLTCNPSSGVCEGNLCAGVTCPAPTQCQQSVSCNPASGLCTTIVNRASGAACSDGSVCTQTDACDGSGTCAGSNPLVCQTGTCNPATGCPAGVNVPRVQIAKKLEVNYKGLAQPRDGSLVVGAKVFLPTKTFDGVDITSNGAGDVLVGRYGPTGALQWVKNFGDVADQDVAGVAATADGTVAVVGFFTGTLLPSNISTSSPTPIDYLLLLDGATGDQKPATGATYNNGIAGRLQAIATNPGLNLIAVCGYASVAATQLVPGATYAGGTEDLVIALFNSSGTRLWSRQIGGAQEERCNALAIDDAGAVYAAGQYDGALDLGLGALPNPASSVRRHVWVAKFNGTSGATLQNTTFGNVAAAGNHNPRSLAIDAGGNLVVAGFYTNTLPIGATSLVSAGAADTFVTKLNAAFAPQWAVRMGASGADELRSVALDSLGNLLVTGLFSTPLGTPTTGFAALTAASTTASDAFLVMLDPNGVVVGGGAQAYGDGNSQSSNLVVVNRGGTGTVKDLIGLGGAVAGTIDFGPPTSPLTASGTATEAWIAFFRFQP